MAVKPGPLVYVVDTRIPSGSGTMRVLPINDIDTQKRSAPLSAGQVITYGNVTITCISTGAAGDVVKYEIK